MSASIRGHQGQLKFFEDGQQVAFTAIKKVSITQDSTFSRSFYLGESEGEGDQAIEGWSGNVETEVKNAVVDEFIDRLVTNNQNGIGVADYTFISTELYADGTTKSYVYYDCQFKMSKEQGGLQDKMTKRLDVQAAGRKAL